MSESITSFSTDADRYFDRRNVPHTWDVKLFFEPASKCEQHPDFLQARPLLHETLSKNKLKRYFLLKNVKDFAICYKIVNSALTLNMLPLIGVIDAEAEEIIHVTFKPNEETRSQNEALEIYATRCPCPSVADNIIAVREFWNNVSPDELSLMRCTMVIVEYTRKPINDMQKSEETLISVNESTNFTNILTSVAQNLKCIALSIAICSLLILNYYV